MFFGGSPAGPSERHQQFVAVTSVEASRTGGQTKCDPLRARSSSNFRPEPFVPFVQSALVKRYGSGDSRQQLLFN